MPGGEGLDGDAFRGKAEELLEEIARARKRIEGIPGILDGTLDRFRERIDRLIRESEVDNWRQVKIFVRDVDALAGDVARAAKEKRLAPKYVAVLDLSLRKMKKRDFYGARKAWRKLDKTADQAAEVRRLEESYRDAYRAVEARIRALRSEIDRLGKVPKPPASPADSRAFVRRVDAFNEAMTRDYQDFLARARGDVAIPILLDAAQGGGIGIPAPPRGTDAEPLLKLLGEEDPERASFQAKSFYGLLELPGYSDAKLTHTMGDARLVRSALDAAWPWLKLVRDDASRSLRIEWTEDVGVLRRRVPALVGFLVKLGTATEALALGRDLAEALEKGDFERLQQASRAYGSHGEAAEKKWSGVLENEIEAKRQDAAALAGSLKGLPEPERS